MDRHAHGLLEQRFEVRQAESRHARKLSKREVFSQMLFDVLEYVAQSPCRQRTSWLGGRGSVARLQSEKTYGKRGGEAVRE